MYLDATGMACPVGLRAAPACAALRAGIVRLAELPYRDTFGQPIIGGMVPGIPLTLPRTERLWSLLHLALSDCLDQIPSHERLDIRVILCLGEPARTLKDIQTFSLLERIHVTFGLPPRDGEVFTTGHTSGIHALALAEQWMKSGVSGVLLCGVDSYLNADDLAAFARERRLKTRDNSDGVIPGEAAAVVFVRPRRPAGTALRVAGIGFGFEDAGVLTQKPLLGLGLSEAVGAALAREGLGLHQIDYRISDLSGESYGFKEQALMLARLMRERRERFVLWHCADSFGDPGAATGLCQMVVAARAEARGYAPGPRSIICTSVAEGERAAVVLCREHTT